MCKAHKTSPGWRYIIAIIGGALVLGACSKTQTFTGSSVSPTIVGTALSVATTPPSSVTEVIPNTLTPTVVSTDTPIPTAAPFSPTPDLLPLASLPSGEYVVYSIGDNLYVTSPDGLIRELLLTGIRVVEMSAGGKMIHYESNGKEYVLDLEKSKVVAEVPLGAIAGCQSRSMSPDFTQIALSCEGDIYVQSLRSGERTLIMARSDSSGGSEERNIWEFPNWSPDGKWIAYLNPPDTQQGLGPKDGLYLTNTSCLFDPTTCKAKTRGPFRAYSQFVAWSPNSQYIAVGAAIFDNVESKWKTALTSLSTYIIQSLAWSPDSKTIAVGLLSLDSNDVEIFRVPSKGGDPIAIPQTKGGTVWSWLLIP